MTRSVEETEEENLATHLLHQILHLIARQGGEVPVMTTFFPLRTVTQGLLIAYSDLQRNLSLCRVAESIMSSLDGMQRKPRKFVCDFYDDPNNYLTANYTLYKITQKNNNVIVKSESISDVIQFQYGLLNHLIRWSDERIVIKASKR